MIDSAAVEICNSLRCLPVLPFEFGGGFCRGSNGLYQPYVAGDLFLFLHYLLFLQLANSLRLVSADSVAFAPTAWAPCSPAFTQFVLQVENLVHVQYKSFCQCPLHPNSFSTHLGGVVCDTVYDYCGGGGFSTILLFAGIFYCLSIHPYQLRTFVLHKSKTNCWRPRNNFGAIF